MSNIIDYQLTVYCYKLDVLLIYFYVWFSYKYMSDTVMDFCLFFVLSKSPLWGKVGKNHCARIEIKMFHPIYNLKSRVNIYKISSIKILACIC